jgi:hypothetical protein
MGNAAYGRHSCAKETLFEFKVSGTGFRLLPPERGKRHVEK